MTAAGIDSALQAADAAADRFLEGRHIPGVVYGVVLGGELAHVRGIGTLRVDEEAIPDADSVFRIASMTKSFTAATVLSLRDDGLLRLDDPAAAFVPDLAGVRGPTADSPPITIRHLLTMTAGFPTDDPWGDRQQALDLDAFAALLRAGPGFARSPGTRFEYSNLGYGILGRVITAAAGKEYREAVGERILAPLGMSATTFLLDDVPAERLARGYLWRDEAYVEEPIDGYGALASMGGLFTSVGDLAPWVAGLAGAFPPRDEPEGTHPLSRATRREMQQIHASIPPEIEAGPIDAAPAVKASGYGFGLFIEDDLRLGRVVAHSGGYPGFGSNMRWQSASGLGVIVLANHRYAPATLMARELLSALAAAEAAVPRRIRPSPATDRARAAVERLLLAWDDDLAESVFAMNVDLDEPLSKRRATIARARELHGRLTADPEEPPVATSSHALEWWMIGESGGRVRLEILLSPEPVPRIQALTVQSVPAPDAPVRAAAEAIVRWINDGPAPRLGAALDGPAITRTVRAAGARYGRVRLGPPTSVEPDPSGFPLSVTFRLVGDRGGLTLRIAVDGGSAEIAICDLRSSALTLPAQAD